MLNIIQVSLDILLFSLYFTLGLTIFIIYIRCNINSIMQLFPNLWLLSSLFMFFRSLQKLFEILVSFSMITIEASIMDMVFKIIILFILCLMLMILRDNYGYFIELSKILLEVNKQNK